MFRFFIENLPTILVGAVVFGILAAIVIRMIMNRRNNKGGCGGGCDHCPSAGSCHPK